MNAFWCILLLIGSNICMTFAWYGHLKLQEMNISNGWPLILVFPDRLHRHRHPLFQGRGPSLEPPGRLRLPYPGSFLRFSEVRFKKVWKSKKSTYLCNPKQRETLGSYNG